MWATDNNPNRWYRRLCWLKTKGRGYESNYRRGNGIDVYQREDCSASNSYSYLPPVVGTYLSGHNDKEFKGTVQECFKACAEEKSFVCKSFDYVKSGRYCNLSKVARGGPGVSMGRSTDYSYYQRVFNTTAKYPSNYKAPVKGTYLSGNNDREFRGSVEECFKACNEEKSFVCKSFDSYKSGGSAYCNLSRKARGDRGVSMVKMSSYTYYERIIKKTPTPKP